MTISCAAVLFSSLNVNVIVQASSLLEIAPVGNVKGAVTDVYLFWNSLRLLVEVTSRALEIAAVVKYSLILSFATKRGKYR